MKRVVLCAAVLCTCGLAAVPQAAMAELSLRIGPQGDPAQPDVRFAVPPLGTQYFDLTFTETGPPDNEALHAFDLGVSVVRPEGVTGGVRLLTGRAAVAITPEDFIFPAAVNAGWRILETDPGHLLASIRRGSNEWIDITTGKKAARIFYEVDPDAIPGTYFLAFDLIETVFGSVDITRPVAIEVDLSDRGVIVVAPEPSGLALLGIAGLLSLRRRRR